MVAKVMRCFWPREPAARRVLLQLGKDACFWLPEPASAGAVVLRAHVLARAPIWQGRAQAQSASAAGGGEVPQETFLFTVSICDNIMYGRDRGFRPFPDFILT